MAVVILFVWLIVSKTVGVVIVLSGGLFWMIVTCCRLRIFDMFKAFLWMLLIGLVLFFSLWPCFWYDLVRFFFQYVVFHWEYVHYF